MSSESIKNSIISEIEENLSFASTSTKPKLFEEDVFTLCAERDNLISKLALQKALLYGIDSRYINNSATLKYSKIISNSKYEIILDEQFEAFLGRLELLESEEYFHIIDEEESLSTWRDKILSIKLSPTDLEPLLQPIKSSNILLYDCITQHILITGLKSTKKSSRKEKRADKDKSFKKNPESLKNITSTTNINLGGISYRNHLDNNIVSDSLLASASAREQYREIIGAFVAKTIADDTLSGYLICVTLLLHIMKENGNSTNISLPVGNIIAALFESKESNQINPFKNCLISSNNLKNENISVCEVSRVDGVDVQVEELDRDSASSISDNFCGGGHSDAGSTIGSTLAEIGTETASLDDTENDDNDEQTEEELLAQALALSMGQSVTPQIPRVVGTSNRVAYSSSIATESICSESVVASSQGSVTSSLPDSQLPNYSSNHRINNNNEIPSNFPDIPSLSTWGPFCNHDFWLSIINLRTTDHSDLLPSLSIRNVLFSLITVISASVDNLNNDSTFTNKANISSTANLPILPSSPTFLLIEMILEFLIKELNSHCYNIPVLDNDKKEWLTHRYFLVWSIIVLLKLLSTMLKLIKSSDLSLFTLGLSSINNFENSNTAPLLPSPLLLRLSNLLYDCIQLDNYISETNNKLVKDSFEKTLLLSDIFSNISVDFLQETYLFQHSIKMFAIDNFITGFTIYKPISQDRFALFRQLLIDSPQHNDENIRNVKFSLWEIKHNLNSQGKFGILTNDYYLLYMLQKMCILNSSNTYFITSAMNNQEKKLHIPQSINSTSLLRSLSTSVVDSKSMIIPPDFPLQRAISHTGTDDVIVESIFDRNTLENQTNLELKEIKVDIPIENNNESIEKILIDRLSIFDLMLDEFSVNKINKYGELNSSFWGELELLKSIQQFYIKLYIDQSEELKNGLIFNSNRCSNDILLSGGNKIATFNSTKSWSTCSCIKTTDGTMEDSAIGMDPNSGIHEWSIRIDKCDKGNIFVGVITEEATLDSYIGCDKFGWGLIGTKSYWHNKMKVKSDIGHSFSTGSVVNLKLDTIKGIFSIYNGKEWITIVSNLPKVILYPAISMHHREDRITLISTIPNILKSENTLKEEEKLKKSKSKTSNIDLIKRSLLSQTSFFSFIKLICSNTNKILQSIENINDSDNYKDKVNIILSHPLIGLFIPSLISAVILNPKRDFIGFTASQLIPYFTILTKRMSCIYESLIKLNSSSNFNSLVGNIQGKWVLKSSSNSDSIPAQEYSLILQIDECIENKEKIIIIGHGDGDLSEVKIEGTQYGTKLKFLESWNEGGTCIVEGRLSLCGCFFEGIYTDTLSNKTGVIEGSRKNYMNNTNTYEINDIKTNLLNSSILCSKLCGLLSAHLVLGLVSSLNYDLLSDLSSDDSDTTETESNSDLISISNCEFVDHESDLKSDQSKESDYISNLSSSDLFSGGLPLNDELLSYLHDQIQFFTNPLASVTSNNKIEDNIFRNWWLSFVFPILQSKTSSNTQILSEFLFSLSLNKDSGKQLDEYVCNFIGQTNRVGGDSMKITRRLVLISLIKHCGVEGLCLVELSQISKEKKLLTDRPHALIIEVWRCAQKVIENAVRMKQKTGLSYEIICENLNEKANILINIECNNTCNSIINQLEIYCDECYSNIKDKNNSGQININFKEDSSIQLFCSKLLKETSNFLNADISNNGLILLKSLIKKSTFQAICRTAGLRSYMLLFQKTNDDVTNSIGKFQSLQTIQLQYTAVEYISLSLHGHIDIESFSNNRNQNNSTNSDTSGHYTDGFKAVNASVMTNLKSSFESLYEYIASLLTRCNWGNDREGQCVSLSAWGIIIRPSDHIFLNRVGIFRILQTVLDDTRTLMSKKDQMNDIISSPIKNNTVSGKYWDEMVTITITRLSTLVLRVVHSLASQVTFTKEDNSLIISTNKLQKMASGPDTLSQSLFDMLYAELFISIKDMISLANKYPINEISSSPNIEVNNNDILLGEQYIYKILRLLYFVSNSPTCQKSLSTPKWYSLLISSIGCGGLGVQRRIMRLLRRLLVNINPVEFKAFVPLSLFNNRNEIILSNNHLDEDDIDIIIDEQINNIENNDGMIFASSSSAERLIYLFLEAISVLIPPLPNSNLFDKKDLVTLLQKNQTITESLSAEAMLVLRVLQGVPVWRIIINSLFHKLISCEKYANKWENENYLRMISSSLSVCGGYIDRLRIGGIACLRPFCLLNSSDSLHFGSRLAGTTRSCGMIVGLSDSSVEVILMEKGIRQVKSIHNIPTSDIKTIQHTTSVATSLPIIAVKINRSDIISSSDVPVIADFISNEVFSETLLLLAQYGIPWLTETCAISKEKNKQLQVEISNLPSQSTYISPAHNSSTQSNFQSDARSNFDFNFNNQGQINLQRDDDDDDDDDEEDDEEDEEDNNEEDNVEEDNDEEDNDEEDNDEDDNENTYKKHIYNQSSNLKQSSKDNVKPEIIDNREEISDKNAVQIYAITNMFRSTATLLQSEPLSTCFISSSLKFKDLLDLSNEESICGDLSVIEGIEERWSDLWDKYNILMSNAEVTVDDENESQISFSSSNSNVNIENNSSPRSQFKLTRTNNTHQHYDSNQSQLNQIPLMEAVVAAGIFGESRVPDEATQQAAVAQMLEMGLPKDWCEVALRRCRYNVEMAINMCFEHDQGMIQIVAEDALMREAQQARGNDRPRGFDFNLGFRGQGRSNSSDINLPEPPQQKIDIDSLVNNLLEMGFPKSWCVQALKASNNDVDAALIWILQHGNELKDDDEESVKLETELEIINPLSTLSGTCQIFNDLKCVVNSDNRDFPSVGCKGFGACTGKWYYEITLIKSGCVQIGWADSSYQGCALEGEGVGDDAHSWAYDGYRSYIWHEISAAWGAKWSNGDVVGCSIDIDNRQMSFTLNGYGEEVNMGLAFSDFEFKGHLYPCISLSKSECVQFNLGSTPFKHQPSSEYQGFIKHIKFMYEENVKIKDEILSRDVNLKDFIFNFNKSELENANSNFNKNIIEDSLEYFADEDKFKNDRDLQWKRHRGNGDNLSSHNEINRYFNNEGNINKHDKKMNYSPNFPTKNIPENKKSILFQFSDLSKDLCILYSRLSVLRIINSFSIFSHEIKNKFILQLSDYEDKDSDDQVLTTNTGDKIQNILRSLMKIVRSSCLTSNRTISYLQIMSLLPSSASVPSNLGSIYSIGGFPLLDELNNSMKSIISYFRLIETNQIIESLLDQISVDTINSSRRDFSSSWQIWPNGITPFVIKENNLSGLECITFPSLTMAMWLTPLLLEQFSKEISDISISVDADKKSILIYGWIERLVKYWCFSLRSPSVLVKTCGMKMLSIIVQELSQYGIKYSNVFINTEESRIFNKYIPLERLKKITLRHLSFERGNLPICSEYLQTLLDLVISTSLAIENNNKFVKSNLLSESKINKVETSENFPLSHNESIFDSDDPDFNWENINGRLFSDDGWQTWTGSVNQLQVINDDGNNLIPTQIYEERRNNEDIPELLPGCKVFRLIKVPNTTIDQPPIIPLNPLSNDVWNHEHTDIHGNDSDDSDVPTNISYIAPDNNSPVPIIRISSTDSITPSPSSPLIQEYSSPLTPFIAKDLETTSIEQFGTVIGLTSWGEGGLSIGLGVPGTARIIKWDNIEEQEVVAWGAGDKFDRFDVTHVKLDKDNKIIKKYSNPKSKLVQLGQSYFGSDSTFGIILRVRNISRKDCDHNDVANRLIGIMEWPDFNSVVYISGYMFIDGRWSFSEKKLVIGPKHASWGIRFGQNHWRAGTTYDISPCRNNNLEDYTDRFGGSMIGQFQYSVNILKGIECNVVGDITLQRDVLFKFDNLMKSPGINVSIEKTSITKGGPLDNSSPGLVYGNVGFSSGVHFWEIKIDQCEPGSIYVGVAEKDVTKSQCPSRWIGSGFVNDRTALQGTSSPNSERERGRLSIYGDQFNTGDTVGVMLDMNRGRLSFFLDGLKYGEHIIEDLGEAFDSLATPFKIRPRTLFPVVGLKSPKNLVVLTPRWLSSIGINQDDELNIISKAWELMSSWDIDRPMSEKNQPKSSNIWAYKYAWNDWRRWKLKKYVRVRTRCKASSMLVAVDTSPYACVEASIRLGLSNALFKGDRILFSKSAGRSLDTKEEAVILGGYRGKLWYRLDTQQGDDNDTIESSNLAWSLVPHDIEGMTLIRRGNAYDKSLSQEILDIPLPRIPLYHGGMIAITYNDGAVVRDGIEIDTSEVIFNIPQNSVLYAVEKRVNSSNITRYRVVYQDISGWISERMRGTNEALMLSKLTNSTDEEITIARDAMIENASKLNLNCRVEWVDVSNMKEALDYYAGEIDKIGCGSLLKSGSILSQFSSENTIENEIDYSLANYISLSMTIDGTKQWSIEADMQLSELISKCSIKEGVIPINLSYLSLKRFIESIEDNNSMLINIDINRTLARASILRVTNQLIGYALPYLNITLPEEKRRYDAFGTDNEIQILSKVIKPNKDNSLSGFLNNNENKSEFVWIPPCCGRNIRSVRRVLFTQTKKIFWESVLVATTTSTPLHPDEYEDPREIKSIKINRVKATQSRLAAILNPSNRIQNSVFGQLHKELRSWNNSQFRRSYLGKGHGGQQRSFKVKFLGEGVNDYGGPYRAVFEQIVDELQCDSISVSTVSSERCLLPLLIPSSNRSTEVGPNQDKFTLSTVSCTPIVQEFMHFCGKLMGTAVRQNLNMCLDLSPLLWNPLVKLPVSFAHIEAVDTHSFSNLNSIIKLGLQLEKEFKENAKEIDINYQPSDWLEIDWTIYLPDGSRVPLILGGEEKMLTLGNWREYVHLVENYRLREGSMMLKMLRDGLSCVVPIELLPIFTSNELETLISGQKNVDISLLKQCTEYEDILPDSKTVIMFWELLEEFSDEERTLFLRFVWARSRMPTSSQESTMNFKLQGSQGDAKKFPDKYLPHAQTCFFSFSLPEYSTKDIMREKILYAIHNSPNMDADVRLHSTEGAEGWN